MRIEKGEKIGVITAISVKGWRAQPGNFTAACQAAAYYVKKHGESMVIIPGNSYMNKVYHIAKESDSLSRYAPGIESIPVAVVTPKMEVFKSIASK